MRQSSVCVAGLASRPGRRAQSHGRACRWVVEAAGLSGRASPTMSFGSQRVDRTASRSCKECRVGLTQPLRVLRPWSRAPPQHDEHLEPPRLSVGVPARDLDVRVRQGARACTPHRHPDRRRALPCNSSLCALPRACMSGTATVRAPLSDSARPCAHRPRPARSTQRVPRLRAMLLSEKRGAWGAFYKASVIGTRLHWQVSLACVASAVYILLKND